MSARGIAESTFWAHVQITDACWIWTGRVNKGDGTYANRGAHCIAYELIVGPVPAGRELHRTCLTRLCVNPAHFEPLTRAENMRHRYHAGADGLPLSFWLRVEKTDTCWLWTGANIRGYGSVHLRGRHYLTHRAVYEALVGPIPDGMQIDHMCRVRPCVNPAHLHVVTGSQNQQNRPAESSLTLSGLRGVSWEKSTRKWRIHASAGGVKHRGPLFDDVAEAAVAVVALRNRVQTNNLADRRLAS